MFPVGSPELLLSIEPRERASALDAQSKRAQEFLTSSGRRLPNENLPELAEYVFEHTYVRIKPVHLRRILTAFPYVERMLAKYGFTESVLLDLYNAISITLVGTEFMDRHEFKDILERQANRVFDQMDNHDERIGNPHAKALNALPRIKDYDPRSEEARTFARVPGLGPKRDDVLSPNAEPIVGERSLRQLKNDLNRNLGLSHQSPFKETKEPGEPDTFNKQSEE